MLHIRSGAVAALIVGGMVSFYASGVRTHRHAREDCNRVHIEADPCHCGTWAVAQDFRDKGPQLECPDGLRGEVLMTEAVPTRYPMPFELELSSPAGRDPPSPTRSRAPPLPHA